MTQSAWQPTISGWAVKLQPPTCAWEGLWQLGASVPWRLKVGLRPLALSADRTSSERPWC